MNKLSEIGYAPVYIMPDPYLGNTYWLGMKCYSMALDRSQQLTAEADSLCPELAKKWSVVRFARVRVTEISVEEQE